ncbi:MAG: hypothetical protein NTW19_11390 [Planctomycetota bacterium]|nr:hypothetical protein [Planctomycetota bacterium]
MFRDRLANLRNVAQQWLVPREPAAPREHDASDAAPAPTQAGESAAQRLDRLAHWCVEGQLAAAELELHEWRREPDAPEAVRFMLAALFARRHADDDALALLRRGMRDESYAHGDADGLLLAIALFVAGDLPDSARQSLLQLFHHRGDDPGIAAWIRALELPGTADLPAVPDAQIERLAAELLSDPEVIPTLVAAQKVRAVTTDLTLLRQAIARMLQAPQNAPHPALDLPTIYQALAELAMLAHDADDARRWAHRGLRINPYSAALALVVSQVDDDETLGPPAQHVLAGAIAANPRYADLRAALIRRQRREGKDDEARLFLADWLGDQPDHPLALQLQRELAA